MLPEEQDTLWGEIRGQATPRAVRRFAFALLAGLPAAGVAWLLILRVTTARWNGSVLAAFVAAGAVLGGSVLASPAWGRRLYVFWHATTRVVEQVVTWILLAFVFWLIITPVGIVRRRSGALRKGPSPQKESYWQPMPAVKDPSRYYRQF